MHGSGAGQRSPRGVPGWKRAFRKAAGTSPAQPRPCRQKGTGYFPKSRSRKNDSILSTSGARVERSRADTATPS